MKRTDMTDAQTALERAISDAQGALHTMAKGACKSGDIYQVHRLVSAATALHKYYRIAKG